MSSNTSAAKAAKATRIGPRRRRQIWLVVKMFIAFVVVAYAMFPVVYVFSSAINPLDSLVGASLIPRNATLENFQGLLNDPQHPFPRWILNSIIVSSISAALIVALTAIAGYSFSRFRYRGRRVSLLTLVLVQLFPNSLAIVALFLLLRAIGEVIPPLGLNALGGLILIYTGGGLGFNTWLLKGYFDSIPTDLDESARVDGASPFQAFRLILLPLARPILAVIATLSFIGVYSDFLIARVMLQDTDNYTLAVGMTLFIRGQYTQEWGVFSAAALVGALPIMVLFLVLQRQLVGGLARGGVKG